MQHTRAHTSDKPTQLEEEGRRIARAAAAEAIVLLENDGTLPLQPGRIALFGTGACKTVAGGSGSGEVNVRHAVTVREGLEAADFEVATAARLDAYERQWRLARQAFVDAQRAKLRVPTPKTIGELIGAEFQNPADAPVTEEEIASLGTNTCIYVIARQSGEGLDRADEPGSFRLTEQELADIRMCASSFSMTVVVLNVGAPIDVSWRKDIAGVNALVHMGQLGQEGGHALADILTGAVTPSGKLAVTWPESIAQVPFAESYGSAAPDPDVANYAEGLFVGYRYYTSFDVNPAYSFGHGLSYTSFTADLVSAEVSSGGIALRVEVRNIGRAHAGKHVAQVYASCPAGELDKEAVRLVAFGKTPKLLPGESTLLELAFGLDDLASYDERRAQRVLDSGDYVISLGEGPFDLEPAFAVRLGKKAVLSQHRSLCASKRMVAKLHDAIRHDAACEGVPVYELEAPGETVFHEYDARDCALPEIESVVDALDVRQQLALCVGTGLGDDGKGLCVPGAVGHTTASLLDVGVPNVELCDGPAGIRIQRRSAIDAKGAIKPIDPPLSIYELLPTVVTSRMFGNPDSDRVVYQHVTGFPAASCMAQTWNVGLARQMGEQVGREMAEYGVTYWLAPALNIVRNPLCGRNFEYYSEDPLVSGKFAAAVVRGVQSEPGRYACLKHFAANNQETNRSTSSSNVDEWVLREIYLRGFEIAVREARPASVMAAYNKVNGVYATESSELLTAILRDEWGFDGVVITDWFATGFGHADECAAIRAGVDLIMPGGRLARAALAFGLKTGRLPHGALRTACARVLTKTLGAF